MDHTPRAETVRQLAAAAYIPPVAFVLLGMRRFRDVRLLRFHAYQATGVAIALFLVMSCASTVAILFGNLPGIGFPILLLAGLVTCLALAAAFTLSFYGAVMGYQGNYTRVPVITDWVWLQVNGGKSNQPPKRRRRAPREEDEIDWDELPIPHEEEEPTP